MQAVIIAGGKGTRLKKLTQKIPKPMIKIGSLPLLAHQVNWLKKYKIIDIIILTSYKSEVIEKYFGNGSKFSVNITCVKTPLHYGTADRVKAIAKKLKNDFIVIYGDLLINLNLKNLINFHKKNKGDATLVLHSNDHPFDSDIVEVDRQNRIVAFHSKPHNPQKFYQNLVNAAIYLMKPKLLQNIKRQNNKELDFGRDVFPFLIKNKRLKIFGYITPEYIKDIGTPARLAQAKKDYFSGRVKKFNLEKKQKAIFLDRDGVINYDPNNLSKINDFKLLPKTAQAIKFINRSDFLVIVITNQPMIAKGFMALRELDEIHKKMETLLGKTGAKLDAIYFCPHHPDKKFPGVPELRIKCNCRKPKPGMILAAAKKFNIDLGKSWLIGDSERDIRAGKNAGTKTILVKRNQKCFDSCSLSTKKAPDLYSAVKLILR